MRLAQHALQDNNKRLATQLAQAQGQSANEVEDLMSNDGQQLVMPVLPVS